MVKVFVGLNSAKDAIESYSGICENPDVEPMVFPQDAETHPNQMVLDVSDPMYIAYYKLFESFPQYQEGLPPPPATAS